MCWIFSKCFLSEMSSTFFQKHYPIYGQSGNPVTMDNIGQPLREAKQEKYLPALDLATGLYLKYVNSQVILFQCIKNIEKYAQALNKSTVYIKEYKKIQDKLKSFKTSFNICLSVPNSSKICQVCQTVQKREKLNCKVIKKYISFIQSAEII